MRKTAVAIALITALLASMGAATLQAGYCLSSDFHIYDETTVYDIYGAGINVTITLDLPENKSYNSTATFTLKVSESFSASAARSNLVNPNDY